TTLLIPAAAGVSWLPVAWSPDGSTLALIRRTLDARGVPSDESTWLVQRDGSRLRQLAASGDSWPRPIGWSPDGGWLAVLRGPAENCVSCRVDGQPLTIVS